MRRGVPYYATAPCPAAAATAATLAATPAATPAATMAATAPVAVFLRVVQRPTQLVRQFLIFVIIIAILILSPHAAGIAVSASAAASGQGTQAAIQSYSAWSCRGVYHVVRRGETLYSIARRYSTTAYRIAVCNGLASYTVYVGQTLLVPMARY